MGIVLCKKQIGVGVNTLITLISNAKVYVVYRYAIKYSEDEQAQLNESQTATEFNSVK